MTATYLGSSDAIRHRRDYRPDWLDNLADHVTMERSVLTGIAEGPEAIHAILGFARTLYDYQEFNYLGPDGDQGFVEDYTSVVRGEPIGSVATDHADVSACRHRCLLDPALHNRGIGREMVWRVADLLIRERRHHRLVIDPAADNVASIRCDTAVGSVRSASCAGTNGARTAPGTTAC